MSGDVKEDEPESDNIFTFAIIGGGIAGVSCVEQVRNLCDYQNIFFKFMPHNGAVDVVNCDLRFHIPFI